MNEAHRVEAAEATIDRATLPRVHSVKRLEVEPPGAHPDKMHPIASGVSYSAARATA
eukprot:CAMPEP_0206318560 /NCGR_PEP_ID=MMETSP0106_2-20121207/17257_1 /ASSEMBLY_ACC=CAM_ASM_000206 /TAXON_ID=81532 /ORGANISM="Acanthoeca-like sp., Strain 10tr" /LENGTH=56 /DNA_ID=CAMNT_0053750273 /DNA_START=23 /DNA_END=193 /DNA_ORIENTATION=+